MPVDSLLSMQISACLPEWKNLIEQENRQPYFIDLMAAVAKQRNDGESIYPPEKDVFSAFNYVDLSEVKVVILGQDPYHGETSLGMPQAHGLAFSVPHQVKVPPSLVNIYKELVTDIEGFKTPSHGNLISWAEQGVLLLNTVLTVRKSQAHSHAKLGWEMFTDKVIEALNVRDKGCVFLLWGSHAHKKGKKINQDKHCVLKSVHPSPLSVYRGFYGCKHFSQANNFLTSLSEKPINWHIKE